MMSYKTATAILNLLSTIRPQYMESRLINELNNFYRFDENIFLIDSRADINRFVDSNQSECTPKSIYIYTFENYDGGRITGVNKIKEITSKHTFLIVVSDNPTVNLLILVKYIQRLQIRMKIGIFISPSVPNYNLQNLFHWR